MKSKSVWKILAISVALLMVASVTAAVNQTGNSLNDAESDVSGSNGTSSVDASSVSVGKHPKMSTEVAEMIPPLGIAPPAKQVFVNIYLKENKTEYFEELGNHTIEILYIKENRVVAEIYTSEILEIVDLPFVTYMDTPLQDKLLPEVAVSGSREVYKHPKMSTEVAEMIPPLGIAPPAKLVIVNVYLRENKTEDIEELGNYTIEILYIKENRVVAEIYMSEILEIVDLPFVTYMDTPLQDKLLPIVSEGVKCINADKLNNYSNKGKGVKVAILDHGFAKYKECQEEGELPKDLTVKCFRRDCNITGGGIRHGTACAEIVHDVAPDAELYLIAYDRFFDQSEEIVEYLVSEKVDIVTRSAGFTIGLFDGTSYPCWIIDDTVFKHGIIWVNAAGNEAQRHWEGTFKDTDRDGPDGWHEYPCPGGELGQRFNATKGDIVVIDLSWNDSWGYATQDYDLYIFDCSLNKVASSENPQDGSFGNIPVERCAFKAPRTDTYKIAIHNYSATRPVHFELYSWDHELSCKVEESSLIDDATAFGVTAAGAVTCEDCSTLEPYSSRGPTNDGRLKPDFVGPDCVSTYSKGDKGFCGTSAAAPHVAGAIALQLSCIKKTHPGQKDNEDGYGLPRFCVP